jgi:hypothetical protein
MERAEALYFTAGDPTGLLPERMQRIRDASNDRLPFLSNELRNYGSLISVTVQP